MMLILPYWYEYFPSEFAVPLTPILKAAALELKSRRRQQKDIPTNIYTSCSHHIASLK